MKLPYKKCSPQSSGNSGKAADGGQHTSTNQRWMHSRHSPNGNQCPCASWAQPYWRGSKTTSGRGTAVGTPCPPTSRRYARCIIGAVDRKYIRYVPRLFEHVYTGTRADRKKALEASDISSLVRETERSLQGGTLPNAQQKTRIFFVLMFMLRGIPFVDAGIPAQKGPAGKYTIVQTTEDGTGADRVTHTRSHADGENNSKQGQGLSLFIPPYYKVRKDRKPHTGNTSRHSGHSTSGWQYSGSAWECSRHSAPMQPDTPGLQWLTIARYTPESYRKPWGTPPSRWRKPIWSLSATERLTRPTRG